MSKTVPRRGQNKLKEKNKLGRIKKRSEHKRNKKTLKRKGN
jgi:hypothetical protein